MSEVSEYMQSYADYFWQYEDGGKVIAVPDGHTLAYSELLIKEILPYLAVQGLPRFGALLLALAATSSHGGNTLNEIMAIVNRHTENNDDIKQGLKFAQLLSQLPARYKKGKLRLALLQAIFSSSHNSLSKKRSSRILEGLKRDPMLSSHPKVLQKSSLKKGQSNIENDFKVLGIIGRELGSVEAIVRRVAELPQLEESLRELDFESEKQADEKGFVDQLIDHDKTYHIGALITRLISGLHIPFHSSLPSDQALGGVSDITNKGKFDKLLLSEFAFDDHVLMSRLANNESLFYHREVPPADNQYARIILLDATLKNWGTIRTLSFATMLAIAKHPKNKNPCRVFGVGKSYQEIAIDTIDAVIDALHILDPSLDPGIGLMELFSSEQLPTSEMFFIGSMESLSSPGMQLFSAKLGKRIDHWLHPNANGEISVYKNPKRGKRFVQELRLPLNELWQRPKRESKETAVQEDHTYPILFPRTKFKELWTGEQYAYAVTKNRSLLRNYAKDDENGQGWELVTSQFLSRDELKAVMTHDDLSTTVLVKDHHRIWSLMHFPSCERTVIPKSKELNACKEFDVEGEFFKGYTYSKTLYIDITGKVSEKERNFNLVEREKPRNPSINHYQNIKGIYILQNDTLRIGKQDLVVQDKQIFLRHDGSQLNQSTIKIKAHQRSPRLYTFPDGSVIEHNRDGMLILTSYNPSIPKIFIPCVLNFPLGVATEFSFAGSPYYHPVFTWELLITGPVENKLNLVRLIKLHVSEGTLKSAKEMMDRNLITTSKEEEITALKMDLDQMNVSYTVRKRGWHQQVIQPRDFYNRYIKVFISHICRNGTITD